MSKPLDESRPWPPPTLPAPADVEAMSDDEAREWARMALTRCGELERVLRQVVVWFDAPLEAGNFAADGDQSANDDSDIMAQAMGLNRIIDRAIALLGAPRDDGD